MSKKLVGYKLTYPDKNGWLFLGTTPKSVAMELKEELDRNEGLTAEECGTILITPFEITQKEIDEMDEFDGW